MPYKKYGKAPKRKLRQYRKKGKKMAKKPLRGRPRLRATIKDVLRRQEETKYISHATGEIELGPVDSAGAFQYTYTCGPANTQLQIGQGTNVSERIGNKIKTQQLNVRLIVMPNEVDNLNDAPRPFYVIVYFGYRRSTPGTQPALFEEFYTNGDTDINATGTVLDTFYQVNNDRWVILKKDVIKCGYQHYNQLPAGGQHDLNQNNQYFFNNDFKSIVKRNYNLTALFPKNVIYNDQDNLPKLSRGLYMWVEAVDTTGYKNPGLPGKMFLQSTYKYKDS